MLYLAEDYTGSEAYILLKPNGPSLKKLKKYTDQGTIEEDFIGAQVGIIVDSNSVDQEKVEDAISLAAARTGIVAAKVTEISVVGIQDGESSSTFLAVAAVVDSESAIKFLSAISSAMNDRDIDFDPAEVVSLHIPLSSIESEDSVSKDLIGETITFDQIAILQNGSSTPEQISIESAHDNANAFYITDSYEGCDGYAVLRTSDDQLICCHIDEATAESKMLELLDEEGEKSSEKLVKLSNEKDHNMSFTSKTISVFSKEPEEQAENIFPEENSGPISLQDPGFNIVNSEDLGSLPIEKRAAAAQLIKLRQKTPELEGFMMITGIESGDRRQIARNALTNQIGALRARDLPLPIMYTDQITPGHMTAKLAGWVVSASLIELDAARYGAFGSVVLNETPTGQNVYEMFERGEFRGISADIDEAVGIYQETGSLIDGGEVSILIRAQLMGATLVSHPALQDAGLWLTGSEVFGGSFAADQDDALVASSWSGLNYKPKAQILSTFEDLQSSLGIK